MAIKATYTRLLVNQWDFSSVSNSLEVSTTAEKLDVTCFQATAKQFVPLGAAGLITQKGYFTGTDANSFEEEIADSIINTESLTVAALFGTATMGCPAYVAAGCNSGALQISTPTEGVITLGAEWGAGTGIVRGLRVWLGTFSSTAAQSTPGYVDLGAAGAAGGVAWLFVQTITGSATNAAVVLESDDNTDFSSAATEATFTFSAVGVVQATLSGAVDRYLRLRCTDLGGATSFVVCGIAAASGVTY